jgi:hypothetical protein
MERAAWEVKNMNIQHPNLNAQLSMKGRNRNWKRKNNETKHQTKNRQIMDRSDTGKYRPGSKDL